MGGEGVQAQSGVRVGVEAAADEMLQLGAQDRGLAPVGQTQQDLGVRLKGDVSTHHVVKEDPKAPNCGGIAMVAAITNPFRWGIHSRS